MSDLIWPEEESVPHADCRVFQVSRSTARSPHTGRTGTFFRIDAADWVNVVALTPDEDVVMVRQFRHGSRLVTLEIPGGMVDPGEDPAESAARELREETGYAASDVSLLGVVNPNPALWGNRCHTYLARGVVRVGAIRNEGNEHTEVALVPLADIPARMHDGTIDHALVIAAFHWFRIASD